MSTLLNLQIPSFADTLRAVKRALNAEYQAVEPPLDAFQPTNLLYPLGTVLAYVIQQVHQLVRVQASEATPFGATGSNLDAWLDIYGVAVPAATKATGSVSVTGGNSKSIPSGTALTRLDGVVFFTTALVTFGATTETLSVGVEAEEIGALYNTEVGEELELAVADDDISPVAVSEGIDGGADPADDDAKGALIKSRLAQNRVAGSAEDYRLRSLSFSASIARVFVEEAGRGPGTVSIFPLNRNAEGSEYWEVTVPSAGELAALQAHFEQDTIAKVNDRVLVEALTVSQVPISIALTPNTAEVQDAVRDSLRQRFFDAYDAGGYVIPNSEISGAISAADGEISHTLLDVDGQGASADAVAAFGELLQVGTLTFSTES